MIMTDIAQTEEYHIIPLDPFNLHDPASDRLVADAVADVALDDIAMVVVAT